MYKYEFIFIYTIGKEIYAAVIAANSPIEAAVQFDDLYSVQDMCQTIAVLTRKN